MSISDSKLNKLIKGKKWYHQRFDGSPMFLFAVGEAETRQEVRKLKRTEADVRVCFFSHGKADWYLDMKDVNRGAKVIIERAKRDPKISTKLLKAWEKDEKIFEKFFWKEFPKINLKKLSEEELIELWERYYNLFISRFTSSSIIDHFALGTDEIISDMLRKEITKQSSGLSTSELGELFSIATAPVAQSFINEAEIDLLKIVTKQSKQTLREYQKKYFWTKNNYVVGQELSIKDFKEDIESWKKSGKDLKAELGYIKATPNRNKRKKDKLFKQYKLSKLLRTLIKISDDFSWWQDERKKSTYFNIHIGSKILIEIGSRIGYKLEELKYKKYAQILIILVNFTISMFLVSTLKKK